MRVRGLTFAFDERDDDLRSRPDRDMDVGRVGRCREEEGGGYGREDAQREEHEERGDVVPHSQGRYAYAGPAGEEGAEGDEEEKSGGDGGVHWGARQTVSTRERERERWGKLVIQKGVKCGEDRAAGWGNARDVYGSCVASIGAC